MWRLPPASPGAQCVGAVETDVRCHRSRPRSSSRLLCSAHLGPGVSGARTDLCANGQKVAGAGNQARCPKGPQQRCDPRGPRETEPQGEASVWQGGSVRGVALSKGTPADDVLPPPSLALPSSRLTAPRVCPWPPCTREVLDGKGYLQRRASVLRVMSTVPRDLDWPGPSEEHEQ